LVPGTGDSAVIARSVTLYGLSYNAGDGYLSNRSSRQPYPEWVSRAEDPTFAALRPLGERNQRVIGLVHAFCTHARVEESGGQGLAEVALGLPVNMRSVRCQYATEAPWSAMDLEPIALQFYNANCIECPHHSPTGLLPNLATLATQDQERSEVAAAAAGTRRQAAEAAQVVRAQARQPRRLGEPYTVAAHLEQVDRLDGPSGTPDANAMTGLREIARLRPDVLAESTLDALVELARPSDGVPVAVRAGATAVLAAAQPGGWRLSAPSSWPWTSWPPGPPRKPPISWPAALTGWRNAICRRKSFARPSS
jgi:hypothetical protein